jgi:phosphatidylglycerophosphatase A
MSERVRLHPIVRIIATGGFSGYSRLAPGTAGSLVCAVLAWLVLPEILIGDPPAAVATFIVSLVAFILLAVWAAARAEPAFGPDSGKIVIDEFAGYLVGIALLPKSIFVYGAAFLLFRVIDIVKPFPARRAESIGGGWGIVLDDLVAGVYTNILIRIMLAVPGF